MALVPSDIGSSLSSAQDIFTQASDVVQTVGSIWDTIMGKADATAPKPAAAPAPAPAPVPVAATARPGTMYILIGVGLLIVAGMFWSRN